MPARFIIGQRVVVVPTTWLLRQLSGYAGAVDTVELDEDDSTLLYRVKLDDLPGQGYPYREGELREERHEISQDSSLHCPSLRT